ncbi:hypothetical protein WJX75_003294 [Coccomyxa subellipsoidea]|uniref:Uncharacterized protein n=1 Tax=Coccomyxa subellipsoidea TaxID=248742 RepID=A0ABR2YAW0_9CHLO
MQSSDTDTEPEYSIALRGVRAALLNNFLPFAFFVALIIALAWPLPGQKVLIPVVKDVHVVTFVNICTVFLISGLTLRTDELKQALTRQTLLGTVYGFIAILGITPLWGWATIKLPFTPMAFATGLTIFCIMPTTLGVGVSLVSSAKGNVPRPSS